MNYAHFSLLVIFSVSSFLYSAERADTTLSTQTILEIINRSDVTNKEKVAQIKSLLPKNDMPRDCCPSPFSALYSEAECTMIIEKLRVHFQDRCG
jgi:hypothetical protein